MRALVLLVVIAPDSFMRHVRLLKTIVNCESIF